MREFITLDEEKSEKKEKENGIESETKSESCFFLFSFCSKF